MKKYVALLVALISASFALAQSAAGGSSSGNGLIGVGMGLAIGLGAVGTGLAQGRIGAAAAGVTAENREQFGLMLLWFVIPETLVIFGFVIAIILLGKMS
jgi:V/A-type H+-transporting ATPase subunit K